MKYPISHYGWQVKYRNEESEQIPEYFDPACYQLALDFVNRKEAEGFQIAEIAFYLTTLGRTQNLYEKPITKEELSQVTPEWIDRSMNAIEQELGLQRQDKD